MTTKSSPNPKIPSIPSLDTRIDSQTSGKRAEKEGKQKTLALGIWPEVSLREAREKRDKAKLEIQSGINPIEQRRTEENVKKSQQKLIEKRLKNTFHAVANEWILYLRAKGKSVIFVHHAGKNGKQRGSSRREDVLDTVIFLKKYNGNWFWANSRRNFQNKSLCA